jgi:hypothetical protein
MGLALVLALALALVSFALEVLQCIALSANAATSDQMGVGLRASRYLPRRILRDDAMVARW